MRSKQLHAMFAAMLAVLLLASLAIAGCGSEQETPTPTPVSTVSENLLLTIRGSVTRAGAPVTAGTLDVVTPTGVCGETTVSSDGSFELLVYAERQGRRLGCLERKTGQIRLDGVAHDTVVELKPRRRPLELNLAFP